MRYSFMLLGSEEGISKLLINLVHVGQAIWMLILQKFIFIFKLNVVYQYGHEIESLQQVPAFLSRLGTSLNII